MGVLECRKLSKMYGPNIALNDVDLSLDTGNITGLLGPNGSGKTTMIKLANGLLKPSMGEILVDGKVPNSETKALIAYLPDRDFLPGYMTVDTIMDFYKDFFEDFDIDRARAMMTDLELPDKLPLKKMSKGTREKVQLILTMSRQAKIYLLDEPIAGVDPAARDYILRTIISNYNKDALVLISTHLIADVEAVLDEAVFLQNGHVVLHKSVDDIRADEGKSVDKLFREVFRC